VEGERRLCDDRRMRSTLASADDRYDVVIVGARVAGSALASFLGDRGWRVLLVDRATFPSPTISTHFFRGAGLVGVLDDLGILPQVLETGAPPLTQEFNYETGATTGAAGPPQDPGTIGFALSVRREPLDALLVERAAGTPGVTVVEGAQATAILTDGSEVVGLTVRGPDGEREVRARLVVGADGHNSTVAPLVEAPIQVDEGRVRGCFYTYVSGFPGPDGGPPDGPEFSLDDDEMAYVFPSDAGTACVALSVTLATFAEMRGGGLDAFRDRLHHHRGLAERFDASSPASGLLGRGPQTNLVRVPVGAGWALVGDAGMQQDAWTGLGMDNAGVHARFLAGAIDDWFTGRATREEAMAGFHRDRDAHALQGFEQTVSLGRDLRQLA